MVYVFDMGGVLMDHDFDGFRRNARRILGDGCESLLQGGPCREVFRRFELGLVGTREFLDTVLSFSLPGTTEEQVVKAWNSMHAGIPETRLSALRELKAEGNRIYLLSNNNEIHWQDILDNYAIEGIFDDVFLSFREHLAKPDRRFYEVLVKRTGISGMEVTFVDDLQANRETAESLGWKTYPDVYFLKNLL